MFRLNISGLGTIIYRNRYKMIRSKLSGCNVMQHSRDQVPTQNRPFLGDETATMSADRCNHPT